LGTYLGDLPWGLDSDDLKLVFLAGGLDPCRLLGLGELGIHVVGMPLDVEPRHFLGDWDARRLELGPQGGVDGRILFEGVVVGELSIVIGGVVPAANGLGVVFGVLCQGLILLDEVLDAILEGADDLAQTHILVGEVLDLGVVLMQILDVGKQLFVFDHEGDVLLLEGANVLQELHVLLLEGVEVLNVRFFPGLEGDDGGLQTDNLLPELSDLVQGLYVDRVILPQWVGRKHGRTGKGDASEQSFGIGYESVKVVWNRTNSRLGDNLGHGLRGLGRLGLEHFFVDSTVFDALLGIQSAALPIGFLRDATRHDDRVVDRRRFRCLAYLGNL